ncbi:MAG: leucine-rich repeat domain-containing protein, partial [Bacteroidaceae bacterium]|nr:leucine-rich repeat domain-containing protein [Bacteroidaceae bacterium]
IGYQAFCVCSGLTSVTIGNSVTSIGNSAFYGCSGLKKVIVPDIAAWCGITFEWGIFDDYLSNPLYYAKHLYSDETTEITNLIIPNSVTSIGRCAFYGCSGLTSVTIPNSVTSIGNKAFCYCSGLTSVTIGNSVTSIGQDAFNGCTNLASVNIPNSVKSIGPSAFSGCSSLTSITIPNSVTIINQEAFLDCTSLTSVIIGNGVEYIESEAFANCAELIDVYCYAEKVPFTRSNAFVDSYIEYVTLHVPAASVEQYKATAPWSNFGAIVATDGTIPEPPTPEKCATPTISYSKGELTFSCNTEGAEYVYEITDTDIKKGCAAKVSLTVTYNISVYATKTNYENSDTIQATLCWIEQQPQTEGITDEDAIAEVQAVPVLIQTQGNAITVEGAEAGTEIILYGTNGVQLDSVIATTGIASLNASGLSGSVAIVKIGNKTVKVLIKQ